jgi:hypothetical protein
VPPFAADQFRLLAQALHSLDHPQVPAAKQEPPMPTKKSGRELIDTGTDKRYVRRNADGMFEESDDVGRSLAEDVKKPAKTAVKSGQGDKGDHKSRKPKK